MDTGTYQVVIERTDGNYEKFFDDERSARKWYNGVECYLSRELRLLTDSDRTDRLGGQIQAITVLEHDRG